MGNLIKPKVVIGRTADKITEFVREHDIDLVVMGTTSLKGISKIAAIGSVARKVSETSVCPVILVR
jgi:nucleotide-binding universal stress UspA family protein